MTARWWDKNPELKELAERRRRASSIWDEAPAAEPPRIIKPSDWQGLPKPQRKWWVQDWVPWNTVTGIYGDGGMGKSLLAQQLMTATAIGSNWLGLTTTPGRVLGVFCEDPDDELHGRQCDINAMYGCDFSDLGDMQIIPRFGEENLLMTFKNGAGSLTPFWHQLKEMALDFGAQRIVIDTVADTFGGNENDRGQVRQYVQVALGGLGNAVGGCVVAIAHPSRAGMASGSGDGGSTGWNNAFRSRAYLKGDALDGSTPDPYARILSREKANYALRNETLKLRWHQGAFERLDPPAAATGSIFPSFVKPDAEQIFLQLLDKMTAENQSVSASRHSGNFAPKVFSKRPERQGYERRDFEKAMHGLFSKNEVINQQYGRKSDERYRIVRTATTAAADDAEDGSPYGEPRWCDGADRPVSPIGEAGPESAEPENQTTVDDQEAVE